MAVSKKTVRKPRRRYRAKRRLPPMGIQANAPLGRSILTKLRYTQKVQLNPGAGTSDFNIFACNSAYDPDVTGVGHQPRGYDQLAALFHRYHVLGSRMTVSPATPSSVPIVVACGIKSDSDTFSTISDIMENRSMKKMIVNTNYVGKSLSQNFSGKKTYGKRYLYDDTYQSVVTSSPSERTYFHVYAFAADQTSDPGAIDVYITIDFIIRFYEPINPTES